MTASLLGPATGRNGKLVCSSSQGTGEGRARRAGGLSAQSRATGPSCTPACGGKVSLKRTQRPALCPLTKVTTASKDPGPARAKLKVKCVSGCCFPSGSLWPSCNLQVKCAPQTLPRCGRRSDPVRPSVAAVSEGGRRMEK